MTEGRSADLRVSRLRRVRIPWPRAPILATSEDPYGIVARLMSAVPSGSYLVISHAPGAMPPDVGEGVINRLNKLLVQKSTLRDKAGVERFFDGLEILEPGVVPISQWSPGNQREAAAPAAVWAAVGRKP